MKINKDVSKYYLILFIAILPLSDWLIKSNLTFVKFGIPISDLIVMLLTIYNLLFNPDLIKKNSHNIRVLMLISTIVFINLVGHFLFNDNFHIYNSISVLIKCPIYIVFLLQNSELFQDEKNKNRLFKCFIVITILLIMIDLYIRIAIRFNFPYKFFWTFTRSDENSYIYRGTGFIRSKSLFSEPSYYGQYLNLMLLLIVYRIKKVDFMKLLAFLILVLISILLTYSLSSFFLSGVIMTVAMVKTILHDKKNCKNIIIVVLILIVTIVLIVCCNPDAFERVITRRLKQIFTNGDLSANSRIIGSWLQSSNVLFGNGFGQTGEIWNNLAYVYSDFGIIVMILYLLYFYFKLSSLGIFIIFVSFHFTKGGYMSSFNLITLFVFLVYFTERGED